MRAPAVLQREISKEELGVLWPSCHTKEKSRTETDGREDSADTIFYLGPFRHALRVSELVGLTVEQFDFKAATVHIRRAKNGTPGIHGLQGDELRLIRQLIRENGEHSRFLFLSERKTPLSAHRLPGLGQRNSEVGPPVSGERSAMAGEPMGPRPHKGPGAGN